MTDLDRIVRELRGEIESVRSEMRRIKTVDLRARVDVNESELDDVIHDNVAGEIAAITEKTTPVSADLLMIEDSEASNVKKALQIGNLPSSGGGGGGGSSGAFLTKVGRTDAGASWLAFNSGRRYVRKVSLTEGDLVVGVGVYMRNTAQNVAGAIHTALYTDDSGPADIIGVNENVALANQILLENNTERWVHLPLSVLIPTTGDYWFSVWVGDPNDLQIAYDSTGGTTGYITGGGGWWLDDGATGYGFTSETNDYSMHAVVMKTVKTAAGWSPILDHKPTADTPDDEFNESTLDAKWTVVGSAAAGTVDFLTGVQTDGVYDLTTRPGWLLLQPGNGTDAAADDIYLRQDFTIPDGASIVMAFAIAQDHSGTPTNNEMWVGLGLNDTDTGWLDGEDVQLIFDTEGNTTSHRILATHSGVVTTLGEWTGIVPPHGQLIYFRITRDGLDYTLWWSADGSTWTGSNAYTASGALDNLWIVVRKGTTISRSPIIAVDWIRQGTNDFDPWAHSGLATTTSAASVGDGKGYIVDLPSSPDAMDDEFNDATGMSGPTNGLDSKWSKRNLGTASWLVMDDAVAPGCLVLDVPTLQTVDQAIYQSVPSGDFTVAALMATHSVQRQMQGLFVVDSSGDGTGIFFDTGDPVVYIRKLTAWQQASGQTSTGQAFETRQMGAGHPVWLYLEWDDTAGEVTAGFSFHDRLIVPQVQVTRTFDGGTIAHVGVGRVFGAGDSGIIIDAFRRLA